MAKAGQLLRKRGFRGPRGSRTSHSVWRTSGGCQRRAMKTSTGHTFGGLLSLLKGNAPIPMLTFRLTFAVKICLTVPDFPPRQEDETHKESCLWHCFHFKTAFPLIYDFSSGLLNYEDRGSRDPQIQDGGVPWKFHFQVQAVVGKIWTVWWAPPSQRWWHWPEVLVERTETSIQSLTWPWQECLSSFGSGNDLIWYPLLCTYFHVNECKMKTRNIDLLWRGTGSHTVTTCDLPCEVSLIIHSVL